jgi:hypothetical protein
MSGSNDLMEPKLMTDRPVDNDRLALEHLRGDRRAVER